jgi:hypothetical protein
MTKFDWNNFPVNPDFDALKMKADIQAEILRETEGMTRAEVREFFRKESEEFRAEMKRCHSDSGISSRGGTP